MQTPETPSPDHVAAHVAGKAGRITLIRADALNALSHEMCLVIKEILLAWRENLQVEVIMIDAEGSKAFCAGGDIRFLYEAGINGEHGRVRKFWRDEYRLNQMLADYPKPIVSFMQGITMGGGVGLGCHVPYRVVGLTSQIALPECSIGLVPDVGSSAILAQAPRGVGRFLSLTGHRMDAADALFAGFADHCIPEADWPALKELIAQTGDPAVIQTYARELETSYLAGNITEIEQVFSGGRLQDIFAALEVSGSDFAGQAAKMMRRASPLSLACALGILGQLPAGSSVAQALRLEFRFVHRCISESDFLNAVRAAVIDKTGAPEWRQWPQEHAGMMLSDLGS